MKVFQFKNILEIAQLPSMLKAGVIEEAIRDNAIDGAQLEAAIKLMDIPAAKRGEDYLVPVSVPVNGFDKLIVSAVGQFVFVYEF